MKFSFFILMAFVMIPSAAFSQQTITLQLPAPDTSGGIPLMQAFKNRQTNRDFSGEPISMQSLSDLLWAANGINRVDEGKRTAPSAMNDQEIDVYVVLPEGSFLYDAIDHSLIQVAIDDNRKKMCVQGFAEDASVVLVFVADYKKMSKLMSREDKDFYSATDVGYISQNVYLYCASQGLSTVVVGIINRESIAKVLNLDPTQKVLLSQCVGYPEK